MSNLAEVLEKLQETEAELSALEKAALSEHATDSISLARNSLVKRQQALEREFQEAAHYAEQDVCNYRLFSETETSPSILHLANALRDFQSWFTIVYDAVKSGVTKQRARVTPDIAKSSSLHFGYSYSGSVGFVLTVPNDRLLIGETELDAAMAGLLEMAKAESSDQIAYYAKKFGAAAVHQMYLWVEAHLEGNMGADIQWRRQADVRANLFIQKPQLENLRQAISETSDALEETVSLEGTLVGLDTEKRTFHMSFDDADDIRGDVAESIGTPASPLEVPRRYSAKIRKTMKINYGTGAESTSYYLLALLER